MKKTLKTTMDSFVNLMKGLGGVKDARRYNRFYRPNAFSHGDLNNIYTYNWLAARVIDIPVDDAFREWRNITGLESDAKEAFEEKEATLHVKGVFIDAMKWARLYGGAVVLIVMRGEDFEKPLQVTGNVLENLIPLDRYLIMPTNIDTNILSPNFMRPEYYQVTETSQKVHHSRVIRFEGFRSTIAEQRANNYWGSSILNRSLEPIIDSQQTSAGISTLVYEAAIDVYKIKGLNEMLANGNTDLVQERLSIAHSMKGFINGIALDSEDEYDRKATTFASLAEIDDRAIQKVSGASGIPLTRLIGISPAGQNATGKSDMDIYHDKLASIQENEIRPRISVVDQLIAAELGFDPNVEFEFRELQQLSERETAEIENFRKDRDATYLALNVVRPSQVISELIKNKTYSTLSNEDVEKAEAEEGDDDLDFDVEGYANEEDSTAV